MAFLAVFLDPVVFLDPDVFLAVFLADFFADLVDDFLADFFADLVDDFLADFLADFFDDLRDYWSAFNSTSSD